MFQRLTKQLLLLAALTGGAAGAVQAVLTAPEIAQANQDGSAMVTPSSAYLWGSYLLVSNSTGIKLAPNAPEVDGIAMGTPFERLRYEAYLSQYEGNPLDTGRATAFARTLDGKLSFLIYTHGLKSIGEESEEWQQAYEKNPGARKSDRTPSYLDVFKPASLVVNGQTLQATPQVDGPYQDQFNLANGDFDFRYLGVITYTFDLKRYPNARNVVFSFKDSTGRKYTQKIDLSQYH